MENPPVLGLLLLFFPWTWVIPWIWPAFATTHIHPNQGGWSFQTDANWFRGVGGEHQLCLLLNPPSGKQT
jgi:hypothetical protein